eukprot:GGOE01005467.1.p1 GENE.GGOE01005467.1~~GGOE01005467.1.p1  ORF type:complete len:494 (+),score=111.05 GGOE01005467.1:37-1482(+)
MGGVVTKHRGPQFGPIVASSTGVQTETKGETRSASRPGPGPQSFRSPRCVSPPLQLDGETEHSTAVHLCIENEPDSERCSTSSSTSCREDHLQWSISAQCASMDLGGGRSPLSQAPHDTGAPVDFSTIDVEQMWERGRRVGRGAFSEARLCLAQVGTGVFFVAKRITVHGILWQDLKANPGGGGASEIRELAILRRLSHPNIIKLFGHKIVWNVENNTTQLFICMEYMAGGSLHDLVKQFGPLQGPVLRNYVQEILHGLAHLHQNGIIHRDLKPHNLLLHALSSGGSGVIKLADFGAAKPKMAAEGLSTMSVGSQFTPAYSAPEVFQGECCAGSDVWSLGLCVLEMATAEHPWSFSHIKTNTEIICSLAQRRVPVVPSRLAPHVSNFILRCLQWDYLLRPSCLDLLRADLLTKADSLQPPNTDGCRASPGSPASATRRAPQETDTEVASTVDTYSTTERASQSSRRPSVASSCEDHPGDQP